MQTDFANEIAGLEAGYLEYLHRVNELERIENAFERITRELDEMIARLNKTNQPK